MAEGPEKRATTEEGPTKRQRRRGRAEPDGGNDVTSDEELISKPDPPQEGHCCHHVPRPDLDSADILVRKKLACSAALCFVFMVTEFVGGLLAHSLAIASDAAHMLVDLAGFLISLFSIWMATRPATSVMNYGWYRAEVLGAMASVLLIWGVSLSLDYMAVQRILSNQNDIESGLMVIIALVGLAVNVGMAAVLHSGPPTAHVHSVDCAQEVTENINIRAALIHVMGDFMQSLGVLIAAIVIYFWPDLGIVDPLITLLSSTIVLFSTFRIIKEALMVLMEGTPNGIDFSEVQQILLSIPGVQKVHNLRIWSLSLERPALSAHITVAPGEKPASILKTALQDLHSRLNMFEVTLQVEEAPKDGDLKCSLCKCEQEMVLPN